MKYTWFILAILGGFAIATASSANDDDRYIGVHITIPFSLDAVGTQILGRLDDAEVRLGYDTNHNYQIGVGVGVGEDIVYSAGAAYSSYQKHAVPYAGIRTDYDNDYEAGVVSYGLNQPTTYGFIGLRFGDDGSDNDDNKGSKRVSTDEPSNPGNGGGDGNGDNGDSGGNDGGEPDGPTDVAGNRSGLGDGTNPGKGSGRANSPNTGTSNPHS